MVIQLKLTIDATSEATLKSGARTVIQRIKPNWNQDELQFKTYHDGITNKLLGVWWQDFDSQLLIRVYGKKTESFIDREAEKTNFQRLFNAGLGPELHVVFTNGLCYGYIPGQPTTVQTITLEPVYLSVTRQMAAFHRIELQGEHNTMLFSMMATFLNLIPDAFTDPEKQARLEGDGFSKAWMSVEIGQLQPILEGLNCPVVFCHNDILLDNIIWNSATQTCHFIDYEYAALNYQPFDIGNHFNEFAGVKDPDYSLFPSEDFQRKWLRSYLSHYQQKPEEQVSEEEVKKWYVWVAKFTLISHLFWGSWATVQAQNSKIDFDFIGYAIIRFTEYRQRKQAVLDL